jgi:hypothetical protein
VGANNLTFSSSVIGISYGEMNSIKSNLRRANDMLMQSQGKINSARLKVQVDRGSSRLRVSEEQLNDLYRNAAKRKTKIDKLCNNIDITIRKFKEVDARCAARIRAIGKSADPNKSLWERIKTSVTSFMAFAANGLESIFEEGKQVYESLGTENKKTYSEGSQNKYGYDFLSEWMNSNALATISTGAFAYKSSTSIFDEGRSIFSKLRTSDSITLSGVESCFNSAKILMNEKEFSNLTSKNNGEINLSDDDIESLGNMIGDNIGKSIEDDQKDDWQSKPAKKDIFDNLADWITGDYSEKTQGQEVIEAGLVAGALEQQQFVSEFANDFGEMIRSAVSSDRLNEILEASSEVNVSSINKNRSQTNNRDTHNIDIQAEIRERVLQNIEESKTAREVSNYKQFAEFENGFKGAAEAGNTVWDNIKITQPMYEGTKIPKSFELTADGEKFWVHPNGTKHMVEYITKDPMSHGMPINSQTLLSSFQNSVSGAVKQGIKYDEIMNVGNWELIFSKPRGDGLLPVIKHAVYRP